MILGGDEIGRTQGGNNNAWCQDNEISWFDWALDDDAIEMRDFTRRLIRLRHEHPVFRRSRFLEGESVDAPGLPDAWWFRPDGRRMTRRDWERGDGHAVGLFLNGDALLDRDAQGRRIVDDSFLLLVNAHHEDVPFVLPARRFGRRWDLELDDGRPVGARRGLVGQPPGHRRRHGPLDHHPPPRRWLTARRSGRRPLVATYRIQLTPEDMDLDRVRSLRAVPAGVGRVARVPVAGADGPHGIDPRLRPGRPDHGVGVARRRGRPAGPGRRRSA